MTSNQSDLIVTGSHGGMVNGIRTFTVLAVVSMISACGGGGGSGFNGGGGGSGGSGSGWVPGVFLAASSFRGMCAAPRAGTGDIQGTSTDENNYLRSYSDNTYLWYDEIQDRDPALYATPAYFDLLVTNALTQSENAKDRFHFTYPTDEWIALSQSGAAAGYGAQFAILQSTPPRQIVVAYTDPNMPATAPPPGADLDRGAEVLEVDGVDVVNGSNVDALNAAFFPSAAGETHTFTVRDLGAMGTRTFTMESAIVVSTPVQNVTTIATASGTVGYMLFNSHIATAERGLFNAITTLEAAGVSDLIIDLRYNGGGFLDIASELSYMVAGDAQTGGRTFELYTFNDKHPSTNPITGQAIAPYGFHSTSVGFDPSLAAGTPLPTLDLTRVFVLTGSGTCSASESVMNSLRGVGVEVIQIGSTTCGKPYGFYAQDNCGTTYFTIQFRGENDQGFGDYSDGFTPVDAVNNIVPKLPGCSVGDDFTAALGDPAELRLAAALNYVETGTCPALTGVRTPGVSKPAIIGDENMLIPKSPWHQNRIVRR